MQISLARRRRHWNLTGRNATPPPPSAHWVFTSAMKDSARVSKMLLIQFLPVLKFSKVYKLRESKPCIVGNRLRYCVYLGFEFEKELQTVLCTTFVVYTHSKGDRGSTVVKVLCYKSEGHWFDPSWWIFH